MVRPARPLSLGVSPHQSMSADTLKLSKFDVAERQLLQAIRLFFSQGDEVSIHTLAEASGQVLYDTRAQHGGGTSLVRDSDSIRPEYKKLWLQYAFRAKNFFKHADKDGSEVHEFKTETNHFSLLDAVNLYRTAKKSWTPETLMFIAWFLLKYPELINDKNPDVAAFIKSNSGVARPVDVNDFAAWSTCIEELRSGRRALANITLAMGLPREG
jgi:hypothetical protein